MYGVLVALLRRPTIYRSMPEHPATASTFRHFSAQLYCSGAEEQRCPGGQPAGVCYWHRPQPAGSQNYVPLVAADANRSWEENSRRYPSDRWDPQRAHVPGFRYFGREEAARCVAGKRIHFAGDSTTRDTFYEFAAVSGHPLFSDEKAGAWPAGAYEPRTPFSSGGRDRKGECLGNYDRKKYCLRDERYPSATGSGPETRLSFQFLMRSNSSWEVDQATQMLADRRIDAAFIQCPIYEWFKPDAYNYSKTKEERARVVDVDELAVGPRHWAGMGVACADYLNNVIRPAISAGSAADGRRLQGGVGGSAENRSHIFFLGPTPLPMWTRLHGTDAVEPFVFDSLNRALGIRCRKHADGSWGVSSKSGVTPIDRYSIVGGRRRDAIHPFFVRATRMPARGTLALLPPRPLAVLSVEGCTIESRFRTERAVCDRTARAQPPLPSAVTPRRSRPVSRRRRANSVVIKCNFGAT